MERKILKKTGMLLIPAEAILYTKQLECFSNVSISASVPQAKLHAAANAPVHLAMHHDGRC